MPRKIDRTGERFITNEGYEIIIVEYINSIDVWVEFQDKYKAKVHTSYRFCNSGEIKNPYHKSIYGVACLGLMKDGSKPKVSVKGEQTREYKLWYRFINRCYDNKYQERFLTYKDASICERWLIFANFLEDLPLIEGYELWLNHPNERICLDKDIKGNGSKVYSLNTCCFVTDGENVKEMIERCNPSSQRAIKIQGINIRTGELTKIYSSSYEASSDLGISQGNICSCLNGKRKTASGYKWYKIE